VTKDGSDEDGTDERVGTGLGALTDAGVVGLVACRVITRRGEVRP
jgi:hypothetical protein